MDFQTQAYVKKPSLALKEEDEGCTQTGEEPFRKNDDFELNEVVMVYDTYFLTLKKKSLSLIFYP